MHSSGNTVTRRALGKVAIGSALYSLLPSATRNLWAAEPAIALSASEIVYLMADEAQRAAGLTVKMDGDPPGPKRFWVEDWRTPEQEFAWKVTAAAAGDFETSVQISAPAGSKIVVEGPRNKLTFEATQPDESGWGYSWDKITMPAPLTLPKGESTVRIRLLTPVTQARIGAALKSIELLNVTARPQLNARLRAFRSDASWLTEAKFGLMCQCGEWSYPQHGPHKPWPAMAENFDVEKFAEMVDSTGAGYAIWSATWATYYFPAPIRAIDQILPGRTSKRDLIGEIADALAKRNIRLMLYYHLGHERSAQNGTWWSKNWVSASDKSLFLKNWSAILKEVGERYGDRLAGWLFDDELVYFPMPYEVIGAAAKAGSRSRIIAYNPWIQARGTDFQDFQFGEGFHGSTILPASAHGVWPSGPMKGLQAHGNFQLDGPDWGINHPEVKITPPYLTAEKAVEIALAAAQQNIALSWNLGMYDDGSVSADSLKVLQQAGSAVRKLYPKTAKSKG